MRKRPLSAHPHCSGFGCEFQYVDARGPEYRSDFSLLKCTRCAVCPKKAPSFWLCCFICHLPLLSAAYASIWLLLRWQCMVS